MTELMSGIEFELPDVLAAHEPPEARGLTRDRVRLMISRLSEDEITHTSFSRLPEFLAVGDVLVVNASATLNAAFQSAREEREGRQSNVLVHLSAPLSASRWVIELRADSPGGSSPLLDAEAGERIALPAGATATLIEPYSLRYSPVGGVRLWIAELSLPGDHTSYSAQHGSPIRYSYVPKQWPLSYYQTVFAADPGSAEMPSAGRPFTREIVDRLHARGVGVVPITLHTGVSSLDAEETPYPERYRVSATTARTVNEARMAGGRVIAVGTTVVRALETTASPDAVVRAGAGWTDLVVTPERGLYAVDALLTGLHAPKASHLSMLEAMAGQDHLSRAYRSALENKYHWHEFGDLHLILP
ncbi:MAG: S-adenosylmethionine:tRNA ribosyltransferase-isomerase [Gemmatimonadota bacterium]|nr:S-adenosylmethionine:tRNA ribosyltransferase-isomerase [Gemmatimonadota bacterium]